MKAIFLKAIALTALFLSPVSTVLISVFVLVFVDFLTGILAASKRGEKITSWGMRKTVSKTLAYEVAILLAYLTQQVVPELPLIQCIAGLIALTELKSNLENLQGYTGLNLAERVQNLIQGKKDNPDKT